MESDSGSGVVGFWSGCYFAGRIVDVFTILSQFLSWKTDEGKNYTFTRRINPHATDLNKLEDLNALSRYICEKRPPCSEINERICAIMDGKNADAGVFARETLLIAFGIAVGIVVVSLVFYHTSLGYSLRRGLTRRESWMMAENKDF